MPPLTVTVPEALPATPAAVMRKRPDPPETETSACPVGPTCALTLLAATVTTCSPGAPAPGLLNAKLPLMDCPSRLNNIPVASNASAPRVTVTPPTGPPGRLKV